MGQPCHDVSWFMQYHDIDKRSSGSALCIYFTRSGEPCKQICSKKDTAYGRKLRERVSSRSNEPVEVGVLEQYILYNCCMRGQHRRIMAEEGLLGPLTARWRDEIRRHRESFQPTTTALRVQENSSTSLREIETLSSLRSSRYNLRSRNLSTDPGYTRNEVLVNDQKSGFHPHKVRPGPTDSIFHKIQDRIKPDSQYAKPGWVYIFRRACSPGYVKIGWSSSSVQDRLNAWSKCGYTPVLLFNTEKIPHARRVETLAHYELLSEWRKEWHCIGCDGNHEEWFEVEQARAMQVVQNWANWMKLADPYDCDGYLRPTWRAFIKDIEAEGQLVIAKTLLKHYYAITREQISVAEAPRSEPVHKHDQDQAPPVRNHRIRPEYSVKPTALDALQALVEKVIKEIIARNPHLDLAALNTGSVSTAVMPSGRATTVLA